MKTHNEKMKRSLFVIILVVILSYSCNNSSKTKDSSLPDITGVYRLPETNADLVITFMKDGDGFKYYIKGTHLDVEGKAILSSEENEFYVTFDGPTSGNNEPKSVRGLFKDSTLTIQNYGNADNQFIVFEDCQDDKYLEFKKQ